MRSDLCKILDKACVHLIDEIDPDNGFLSRVLADGVLTAAQVEQCQLERLTKREKNEKFLMLLKRRPGDCFEKFCRILEETDHGELVRKYLVIPDLQLDPQASTSSTGMATDSGNSAAAKRRNDRHTGVEEPNAKRIKIDDPKSFSKAFDRKHDDLQSNMKPSSRLLTLLMVKGIFTQAQVKAINKMDDDYDKNALLVEDLAKRPDRELETFYSCLVSDRQRHIVDKLTGRRTEDWEFTETEADARPTRRRSLSPVEDSWDTPADRIVVKKSSRQFYVQTRSDAYPMNRETRGAVCIISVHETDGEAPRGGTDTDAAKLKALFTQMHFGVTEFTDDNGLTSQEIKAHIGRMAKKQFKRRRPQCFVLFLLCHGIMDKDTREEFVLGTDGERLSKNEILGLLETEDNLHGVPTLVFFVCCREEEELRHDAVRYSQNHPFVIGFPCREASWSLRNNKGTIYVRCLVDLLMNGAHNTDILALLEQVNDEIRKLRPNLDQVSEYVSTLPKKKKLYFYPGIIDSTEAR